MRMVQKDYHKVLEELHSQMNDLGKKLEMVIEGQDKVFKLLTTRKGGQSFSLPSSISSQNSLDIMALLHLPDHLRQTAMVLIEKGSATANDIGKMTMRSRAIESHHLNELVRMGYLRKFKKSRTVYFSIE
jgi:DNA-binding transcriptional ArsR family regulator